MPECSWCSSQVPEGSRFCLECGRPLAATGEAPGSGQRRGLPGELSVPGSLTLVAVLVAIGGIVLLAGGVWAWGVVALLVAAVLVLLPVGVDRRSVVDFRMRVAAIRESVAVRSRGQVELFRARRELSELEADRSRLLHEFGRAVYDGAVKGITAARTAVDAVVEQIETKEAEIETLIHETEERVRRVQGPVQSTEKLEAPPEPPNIPEPWPPPDEGDIPGPPEPGPADPTPGPEVPTPQHPPAPDTAGESR